MQKPRSKTRQARKTVNEANPGIKPGFLPEVLDRTVIAIPLLDKLERERKLSATRKVSDIIIDLNLEFHDGIDGARTLVEKMIREVVRALKKDPAKQGVSHKSAVGMQYVFAALDGDAVRELVRRDGRQGADKTKRAIYHIWPDFPVKRLINKSISTVKADAAHNSFAAFGSDIVWAVIDSGIDGNHPHFRRHRNLEVPAPLRHQDFMSSKGDPLVDLCGHGTHVAGIIAGEMRKDEGTILATTRHLDENRRPADVTKQLDSIAGMAPRCKLLSLKVLDDDGKGDGTGKSSSIIAAIHYIQKVNGYGRRLLVHGVNLSVGYVFEPEWFACGQSPLCVEIDRLVKSGVVVVVAAGNSGYGYAQAEAEGEVEMVTAGLALTINDPGNADLAITVGSTHRDMPHIYGVSYFSSKGPTGDGRLKPDLLAPGEKIVSCSSSGRAAPRAARRRRGKKPRPHERVGRYREQSGTSMAAPHVSGAIAAFLSIRREFLQHPEEVKRIFLSTATDQPCAYFQGRGLVDLMRAIQSV